MEASCNLTELSSLADRDQILIRRPNDSKNYFIEQGVLLSAASLAASFVVGAENTNVINVAIQLKASDGDDLGVRGSVYAYLSDDQYGNSIVATAPSGGWAIGTDGLLIPIVAGKAGLLVSEADGDIDISITEAGAKTAYLVLVLPSGTLAVSGAITFAA
jgi:hypothetical protein